MLIIFDLDDTLIDTSGAIVPVKMEHALKKMSEEGLPLENFEKALEQLLRINEGAESSKRALSEFLELRDAPPHFLDIGVREVYENIPIDIFVSPLEGTLEVLNDLKLSHELALCTVGIPAQQMAKLKNAGIDSTIFSKIIVAEKPDKKNCYQAIVEELGYAPDDVLVCGDRVHVDLLPAKELGYHTVQMLWGRGREKSSHADHAIRHLKELESLLQVYQ